MDFRALSDKDPFSDSSKRALIIPSRGALYGVARMFQAARNDNPNIRIVETTEDGLKWLTDRKTENLST